MGTAERMGSAEAVEPDCIVRLDQGGGVDAVTRSLAADRMRLHRERRRNGLRCLTVLLRETEVDALIRMGFLLAETRHDNVEVMDAIHRYFDQTLSKVR
jgi:hypothetical protein